VRKFLVEFFPDAKPPPCEVCPPRWVKDALTVAGIDIEDLFDWGDHAKALPDMPKEKGGRD